MRLAPETVTYIQETAAVYVAEVHDIGALNQAAFAAFANVPLASVQAVFPFDRWTALRDAWSLPRLRTTLDEAFDAAVYQEAVVLGQIATRAGIPFGITQRLIGAEWRRLRSTLPTVKEHVQAVAERMVEEQMSLAEFTPEAVCARAGVRYRNRAWLTKIFNMAYYVLQRRHLEQLQTTTSNESVSATEAVLDNDVWYLPMQHRTVALRRDRLRPDIAEVAWHILSADIQSKKYTPQTIARKYREFVGLTSFLGDTIPDLRHASLEAIHRAWHASLLTRHQLKNIRRALQRVWGTLAAQTAADPFLNEIELRRITGWLTTMVTVPQQDPGEQFLSAAELERVLAACVTDIVAGEAFAAAHRDLIPLSGHQGHPDNAVAIVNWGIAILILVLVHTGLRTESVANISIHDWTEVRDGIYALAWRHAKKNEEHVAAVPSLLVHCLETYVKVTAPLRAALGTNTIFLTANDYAQWTSIKPGGVSYRLMVFVARHGLQRDGQRLPLSCTILRRTFTTRSLYDGRSVFVLRLQLGHRRLKSTFGYSRFDRFEHPDVVRNALDRFGRKVLTTWQQPQMLIELDDLQRLTILQAGPEREVDVGFCQHD